MPGFDIDITMAGDPATAVLELDFGARHARPMWVGPAFFDVCNARGHRAESMRQRAERCGTTGETDPSGGGTDPEGTLGDGK